MTQNDHKNEAIDSIDQLVTKSGPPSPRVIHTNTESEWNPIMLRNLAEHEINVLGLSTDIVVFFDENGNLIGWRDDGRKGAAQSTIVDQQAFLQAVITELELPKETKLSRLRAVELPPLGWTQEGVLFLKPVPQPGDILRVWTNPNDLKVIQCLYDSSPYA
jgi:hypothetical protein